MPSKHVGRVRVNVELRDEEEVQRCVENLLEDLTHNERERRLARRVECLSSALTLASERLQYVSNVVVGAECECKRESIRDKTELWSALAKDAVRS